MLTKIHSYTGATKGAVVAVSDAAGTVCRPGANIIKLFCP